MARGKRHPMEGENLPMRNSTAEFLTFARENGADTIAVRFQDEMLWLTLNGIAELFGVDKSVASRHLTNIFAEKELAQSATVAKYGLFGEMRHQCWRHEPEFAAQGGLNAVGSVGIV